MDYETAVGKLDPHEPFALCVPLVGLPAGANQWGHELLAAERIAEAKKLPAKFDVVKAGGQSWIVSDDRVVVRPAPVWHKFHHGGGKVEDKFFFQHELSDPLEVAFRRRGVHFVGARDASGWTVTIGAGASHGATLEEALRALLLPKAAEGTTDA
jgi:hypothetical protein